MACYQIAQELAEDVRCAACANPAGDPGLAAVVIAKISEELGYLCGSCANVDLTCG